MNKLWTFGDSYIFTMAERTCWSTQVALGLQAELQPYGLGGSSLEYMYYTVDKCYKEFGEDDIVLIVLTDLMRSWPFNDRPNLGNLATIRHQFPKIYSGTRKFAVYSDTRKFAEKYFIDHHNEELSEVHLKNFLTWLNLVTKHMKIKPILFSCFSETEQVLFDYILKESVEWSLNVVAGSLCENIDKPEVRKEYKNGPYNGDIRANHMIPRNHKILSNKVLDFIKKGSRIKLDDKFLIDKVIRNDLGLFDEDPDS